MAGVTRLREANTGKNAGIANRAAEAARDTLTAIPGRAMAAVTTASKEETARAGSDTPTGGMATVAAAAAADMVADMADTAAVTLPATAAALGAGVAVAAVVVATKRPFPMCPPDWMQDCAIYTSISYSIFFHA